MACDQKTRLLISCYVDGETTPEETTRAKAHLEQCSECRQMIEQWQGQRTMFEWAYTTVLRNEAEGDWQQEAARITALAPKHKKKSRLQIWGRRREDQSTPRRLHWPSIRTPGWAWTGAITAAIIAGFAIYHITTLPPLLGVGSHMSAGSVAQSARMQGGIQLEIGPNSRVSRIDDSTIKLEKGWINATVRHGSGLRILTRRMEVTDRGTIFRVGTGQKTDYVTVKQGYVSVNANNVTCQVNAGQALLARDGGAPKVVSLPYADFEEEKPGDPLGKQESAFEPSTAQELDMIDGCRRLESRFPDARWHGTSLSGASRDPEHAAEFRYAMGEMVGLREGMQAHFADIAEAMGGGNIDSGEWEIPVAILQLSGVATQPELPNDFYYVRLVCTGNALVWRFSGSLGGQADYPFFRERVSNPNGSTGMTIDGRELKSLEWSTHAYSFSDRPTACDLQLWLSAWPEELKPTLKLSLGSIRNSKGQKDKQAMLTDIISRTAKTVKFDTDDYGATLLYLDPNGKNRLLIDWNKEAGKELCRLTDLAKQGHGGSVILGAFETDLPLESPKAGPGVYLVRLVLSSLKQAPHIEINAADMRDVPTWGSSSQILAGPGPQEAHNIGFSMDPESLPGYGFMSFSVRTASASNGSFSLLFCVTGRPDDTSTSVKTSKIPGGSSRSWTTPTVTWAEGCIRIKQP